MNLKNLDSKSINFPMRKTSTTNFQKTLKTFSETESVPTRTRTNSKMISSEDPPSDQLSKDPPPDQLLPGAEADLDENLDRTSCGADAVMSFPQVGAAPG